MYVLAYDGDIYHLPCGDLCASTCLGDGAPPVYEAEGCFEDYTNNRVLTHQSEACPEGQEAMSPDVRAFTLLAVTPMVWGKLLEICVGYILVFFVFGNEGPEKRLN